MSQENLSKAMAGITQIAEMVATMKSIAVHLEKASLNLKVFDKQIQRIEDKMDIILSRDIKRNTETVE